MKKKSDFWKGLMVCIGAAFGLAVVKLMVLVLLAAVIFFALFSACSDHPSPHSRREVLAYLREEYLGEEITVSKRWTPNVNQYGSEDGGRVWNCSYEDLPAVTFQVTSFRRNGGPVPVWGYDLTDNAGKVLREYYVEHYQETAGSLDGWTEDSELKMEFSTMAEVYPAAEQLQAFCDWYEIQPHAGEVPSPKCSLANMALPARPLEDRYAYIKPAEGETLETCMVRSCEKLLKDFYAFYNIPAPDFPAEELDAYAAARWREVKGWMFLPDGAKLPASAWEGIPLAPNAGSELPYFYISYGGLYELLPRLGLEPEGTPAYYTVTGADGRLYEFSYASAKAVDGQPCWPVRRDGEALECSHSWSSCAPVLTLSSEVFQAVTGLKKPEK